MSDPRAKTFQKVRFTFTQIGADALYKGISAYPHAEFAFTSLSHCFHIEWGRLGEGSVKAM